MVIIIIIGAKIRLQRKRKKIILSEIVYCIVIKLSESAKIQITGFS